MDSEEIRMTFPRKRIIDLGTFRIALIHGSGGPFGIESRIEGEFERVDAIVYGHTHAPVHHLVRNVYFFNPGSPTRAAAGGGTLGILHLDQDIEGEIVPI
jgi:putative phosphoesterase